MRVPYNWLKEYVETNRPPKEVARVLTMIGDTLDKPIEFPEKIRDLGDAESSAVMDFEDRGNRADIMGIVGLARDLSAAVNEKLKEPETAKIPGVNNQKFSPAIKVESDKVLRWTAVDYQNVKIGPSKPEIQKKLKAYGMEVINNIVDLTNYVMIELGMPLHAFDTDKLSTITLRSARKGEKLTTLEGTRLELDTRDLVAADGIKPLTLTTAVGGRETGISSQTKNILVEAGLYDQPTARRTALRHNIRNETVARLGKYLHPQFCQLATARFIYLMKKLYGYEPLPVSFDYYPNRQEPTTLELTYERLNLFAGEEIDFNEASKILAKLGFDTPKGSDPQRGSDPLKVVVPYYRTDVTMEDDLIEEVLRIRGFDKLTSYLPQRPSPPRLSFPEMDLEEKIRDILVQIGFNETISQPITDLKDTQKTGLESELKIIKLENSWNDELNILRPELISPQLKYFQSYWQQGTASIKIFEVGKTYRRDGTKQGYEKYQEVRKVALTASCDFLTFKGYLEVLLRELGLSNLSFQKIDFAPFKKQTAAKVLTGGQEIGKAGELRDTVLSNFGLVGPVSHAVLPVGKLIKFVDQEKPEPIRTRVQNFISRDFTFTLKANEAVGDFIQNLKKKLNSQTEIIFKGIFENQKLKKLGQKTLTLNVRFFSADSGQVERESQTLKSLTANP